MALPARPLDPPVSTFTMHTLRSNQLSSLSRSTAGRDYSGGHSQLLAFSHATPLLRKRPLLPNAFLDVIKPRKDQTGRRPQPGSFSYH